MVVLAGDSQVKSIGVEIEKMPESKLQQYMSFMTNQPVKVFSVGEAAFSTDQQLLAIES